MYLRFLFLPLLFVCVSLHARQLPGGAGSGGLTLKICPISLVPMPASELRFGAEYVISGRIGIGVDFGYVIHRLNPVGSYQTGDGVAIHPEVRHYWHIWPGVGLYTGLQGFYRTEHYHKGRITYIDDYNSYEASQTSADKRAYGVAAAGGFSFSAGRRFRFETGIAVGYKAVHYTHNGLVVTSMNTNHIAQTAPGENRIFLNGQLPYIAIDLKIGYRATR